MKATSFADLTDLLTYNRLVRSGMSPQKALSYGDNGMGSTNLSTVAGTGPCIALPKPWAGKYVKLTRGDLTVVAEVRDTAPEGVIDMNPDACSALGLTPPVLQHDVTFEWISGAPTT